MFRILLALAFIVIAYGIVNAVAARLLDAPFVRALGQAGSTASFIPEFWSLKIQAALSKALVFASPMVVNSDYEGEIAGAGDTVHITTVGDPDVNDYTGTVTYQETQTADSLLLIDQQKYWAIKVKDVDKAQQAGNVAPTITQRAAYKLKDAQDQLIEGLFAGAGNSVNSGSAVAVTASDPTSAYDDILVPLAVKLDEANVPTDGRFVVVPPWFHGRMLSDDRFIRADANGGQGATLGNGRVGRAAGFDVMVSNNCTNTTGDDYRISAGTNAAITFASQLVETESLRLTDTFADGVRGLSVYGAKLVRPEMVAIAIASQT